jgi:basic membrane protein A
MKKLLFSMFLLLFTITLVACDKKTEKTKDKTDIKTPEATEATEEPVYNYDAIPDTMEAASYEIAFVTDIGQLKDKSFNQGTWEGVKRFAHENKKTYKYYQPANANNATDDDRYNAMLAAVNGGAKIVVCAGFMQFNALDKVALANPNVKFVFVDGWNIGKENVTAIIFQEEQAGYLAGYGAVMDGYTKLGFSGGGGGTNPACQRFGYGYIQGASAAAKELKINVSMKYSWLHGASFSASPELQTMIEGWYSTGTEIVFACGGSMCNSIFSAASANRGKVIGVDVDQAAESPTVLTSAMKGLREGTIHALNQFYNNKWSEISDKLVNLGAKDNAIGLPTTKDSWRFSKFTVKQYDELFKKLQNGTIVVDAVVEDAETKTYDNLTLVWVK